MPGKHTANRRLYIDYTDSQSARVFTVTWHIQQENKHIKDNTNYTASVEVVSSSDGDKWEVSANLKNRVWENMVTVLIGKYLEN